MGFDRLCQPEKDCGSCSGPPQFLQGITGPQKARGNRPAHPCRGKAAAPGDADVDLGLEVRVDLNLTLRALRLPVPERTLAVTRGVVEVAQNGTITSPSRSAEGIG